MASLKLLVVEDDVPSLELMAEVFTSLQAEVRPVDNSETAAALVDREKFDGIFLDLEMPRLHGFDLTHRIRESSWNKSTPIIVVSGRSDRQTSAIVIFRRGQLLPSEAGGPPKAQQIGTYCAGRDVAEPPPLSACLAPYGIDVQHPHADDPRDVLESQPDGNASRSLWPGTRERRATIISTAPVA